MSSYGSMSPPDEGFDSYEPAFYHPGLQGGEVYWTAAGPGAGGGEPEPDMFDAGHFIGRNYGYEEAPASLSANAPYDAFPPAPHFHAIGADCEYQTLPLRYERAGAGGAGGAGGAAGAGGAGGGPGGAGGTAYVRVVKRRSTANRKERRRTQSINTAFADLRQCIPNVPPDTKLSKCAGGPGGPRGRKERRRTEGINSAFSFLRGCIPNVPADTKLSKIKTLRLATSYIAYLLRVLRSDQAAPPPAFRADVLPAPRRRQPDHQSPASDKRGRGRTGWPQHVWALELKNEQNVQA